MLGDVFRIDRLSSSWWEGKRTLGLLHDSVSCCHHFYIISILFSRHFWTWQGVGGGGGCSCDRAFMMLLWPFVLIRLQGQGGEGLRGPPGAWGQVLNDTCSLGLH